MAKFDVLADGPFRYIHSTETGELLETLERLPNGTFIKEGVGGTTAHTLRHWIAILSRRFARD